MTSLPFDLSISRMTRVAAVLSVLGTAAVFAMWGAREALGFAIGAMLSLVTIRSWFKLAGSMGDDGSVPGGGAAVFLVLRYLLIAGAIYATIKGLGSSPAVLIAGLLVSFAAILAELLFASLFRKMAPKTSK